MTTNADLVNNNWKGFQQNFQVIYQLTGVIKNKPIT